MCEIMSKRKGRTCRTRVKNLKNIENSVCEHVNNTETYELLKWMAQKGFKHKTKMKVHTFKDTGRGLLASQTIKQNQTIVSIPETLIITQCKIYNYELYRDFLKTRPKNYFTEIELLSLFIACESLMGNKSEWSRYIATLPSIQFTLSNITDEQLKKLPKSYAILVQCEITKIRNFYLKVQSFVAFTENKNLKSGINFEKLHWSWNILNSRCVSLIAQNSNGNNVDAIALMPFLDLLNHSVDAKVSTKFCQITKRFEIITLKPIKKHDEVFINYGSHGNRMLLLHYGFIVKNNPNNVVPISKDDLINCFQSCHEKCTKLKLNYTHENMKNWGVSNEGLSWSLKATIRFLTSNYCLLRYSNTSQALYDLYTSVINVEDEQVITSDIFNNCVRKLTDVKIRETNLEYFKSFSDPVLKMAAKLIEDEICLLKNVQEFYDTQIKKL